MVLRASATVPREEGTWWSLVETGLGAGAHHPWTLSSPSGQSGFDTHHPWFLPHFSGFICSSPLPSCPLLLIPVHLPRTCPNSTQSGASNFPSNPHLIHGPYFLSQVDFTCPALDQDIGHWLLLCLCCSLCLSHCSPWEPFHSPNLLYASLRVSPGTVKISMMEWFNYLFNIHLRS